MAAFSPTTGAIALVDAIEKITAPAGEAIVAGQFCRIGASDGKAYVGNGTTASEALVGGIAVISGTSGQSVTMIRKGLIDFGDVFTSTNFLTSVYVSNTDGKLSSSAGTVSVLAGWVDPAWGYTTADKLLRVNL
jgi:hypothetical protein